MEKTLFYICLSLALHVLGTLLSLNFLSSKEFPSEKNLEVYLEKDSPQIPFVTSPDTAEQRTKPKDKVRYYSDKTHRTPVETWRLQKPNPILVQGLKSQVSRSKIMGKEKGSQKGSRGVKWQKKLSQGPQVWNSDSLPLHLPGTPGQGQSWPLSIQEKMPPGVQLGQVTALNVDAHRFYSFMQRLISRFVPHWSHQVSMALYAWIRTQGGPPVRRTWITQVEVIMNHRGEILAVQPQRLSDMWAIDQSTIEAFKKVEQVPNPPKEIIDENGYIRLQFQTGVFWVPPPRLLRGK